MQGFFHSTFWLSIRHPLNSDKRRKIRNKLREEQRQREMIKFFNSSPEALKILSEAILKYPKPIKTWLEFGTLLGFYRENSILKHDTDIDFGIEESDFTEDFILYLKSYGFSIKRKFVINSNLDALNGFVAEYTVKYKGVYIDFFVFKNLNNHKVCYCFDEFTINNEKKYKVSYIEFENFDLKDVIFLEQKFYAPRDTSKHLSSYYGDDFMIPKLYSYEERPRDKENQFDENTIGTKIEYEY